MNKQLLINIPIEIHKLLKYEAVKNNTTIKSIILEMIRKEFHI